MNILLIHYADKILTHSTDSSDKILIHSADKSLTHSDILIFGAKFKSAECAEWLEFIYYLGLVGRLKVAN